MNLSCSITSVLVASVLLVFCLASGQTTYIVRSNCKELKPPQCYNISYFSSNVSLLNSGGFELIFCHGEHFLEQTLTIKGAHNFILSSSGNSTVVIECDNGVGFEFIEVKNATFYRLNITGCSRVFTHRNVLEKSTSNSSSGLYFYNSYDLYFKSLNVSSTVGYGAFLRNVYGLISIRDSYFLYSHDSQDFHGGNMKISYGSCTVKNPSYTMANICIDGGMFAHGRSTFNNLSSGLLILFKCPEISLSLALSHVVLSNNTGCNCSDYSPLYDPDPGSKPYGGNMAVMFLYSKSKKRTSKNRTPIKIKHSNFSQGVALRGGGLAIQYGRKSTNYTSGLEIFNCTFKSNTAFVDGGGIYFQQEKIIAAEKWKLKIIKTIFDNNSVQTEYDAGIGLTLTYLYNLEEENLMIVKKYKAIIENCTFTSNIKFPVSEFYETGKSKNETKIKVYSSGSSALYISQQPDRLIIKNSSFTGNNVTAIATFRSVINIAGHVNISKNTGYEGGGIALCEASYIFIEKKAVLNIIKNTALLSGGGIYAESQCVQKRPLCFYQIEKSQNKNFIPQIFLVGNMAEFAGTQLYGGTVEDCHIPGIDHDIFFELFSFNHTVHDTSYIASDPLEVCFCKDEKPDCSIITYEAVNGNIYSGGSLQVSLVVVGQYNGTVPGEVTYVTLENGGNTSRYFSTGKRCENHSITVDSTNREETLLLRVQNAHADYRLNLKKKLIKIFIKDIPLGFEFADNKYECISKPNLTQYGFKCVIDKVQNKAVIVGNRGTWLGSKNISGKTVFVVQQACPLDYCLMIKNLKLSTNSTVFDSDQQCQKQRTGALCGKCKHPMSLSLGTSHCRNCTHVSFPSTIGISALYAVCGILVVVFLWLFNITITQGTFSGFLFYSNIFYVFREALTTSRKPDTHLIRFSKILFHVVIGPTNLVTYINSCFYNGLDMTGHIWINFLGALYLLTIAGAVVVVSKYSSWLSNKLANNTIQVLATILILSNTVVITSVIYALTLATLVYEKAQRLEYVMLYDGTVPYWSTKHIPLFAVGLMFGLFSVVFTLILLFIQPLQRYSHWKVLHWVNKLKPLLDAYSCPHIIKPNCRFWNGFLLFLRNVLYIVYMFNKTQYNHSIFAITLGCLLILALSWGLGGVYTNRYLNSLSASYVFNMGVLSLIILSVSSDRVKDIAVAASLSVTSITFLGTLMYHIFVTIYHFSICRKLVRKVLRHRRGHWQMVNYIDISQREEEEEEKEKQSENKSGSKKCFSQKLSFSEYREPQLMDYDSPVL